MTSIPNEVHNREILSHRELLREVDPGFSGTRCSGRQGRANIIQFRHILRLIAAIHDFLSPYQALAISSRSRSLVFFFVTVTQLVTLAAQQVAYQQFAVLFPDVSELDPREMAVAV